MKKSVLLLHWLFAICPYKSFLKAEMFCLHWTCITKTSWRKYEILALSFISQGQDFHYFCHIDCDVPCDVPLCLSAPLQVQIVSSYPARLTIHARTAQCAWRSWIRTISLWASAVTVAGASLAPAVKLMWMSAAPAPVFMAFAMTVWVPILPTWHWAR